MQKNTKNDGTSSLDSFKLQTPGWTSLDLFTFDIIIFDILFAHYYKISFVKYFLNKVKQSDLSRKFSSLCNIFSLEIKLIKIRLKKERKASFMNVCYFTKPALALRKEIGSLKSMLAVFCIFSFGPNFPDSFGWKLLFNNCLKFFSPCFWSICEFNLVLAISSEHLKKWICT